jgi:hypothetical protein
MKATLILSALAVLSVTPTASFAQNFPSTFGNSSAIVYTTPAPSGATTTSDRGYVPRAASAPSGATTSDRGYAPRQHRVRAASR